MQFQLAYRPPFAWEQLLNYFRERSLQGIEQVEGQCYRRTVALTDAQGHTHSGWIQLELLPDKHALQVTLSESLQAVTPQALARVRAVGDLDADPERIQQALGELAATPAGLRVPGAWDGFEIVVRAVLGQLVTIKAARTLTERVATAAQLPVETPWPELYLRFPTAAEFLALDEDQLGACGITRRSAAALRQVANLIVQAQLDLSAGADYTKASQTLLAIKGIGPWTVNYVAMRALRWPDAFLAGDYGVKKVLGTTDLKAIEQQAKAWQPWRSYAVMYLWSQL